MGKSESGAISYLITDFQIIRYMVDSIKSLLACKKSENGGIPPTTNTKDIGGTRGKQEKASAFLISNGKGYQGAWRGPATSGKAALSPMDTQTTEGQETENRSPA